MTHAAGSFRVIPHRGCSGLDHRSHQESRWDTDEPTALELMFDAYLALPIGSRQAEVALLELRLIWERKESLYEA